MGAVWLSEPASAGRAPCHSAGDDYDTEDGNYNDDDDGDTDDDDLRLRTRYQ